MNDFKASSIHFFFAFSFFKRLRFLSSMIIKGVKMWKTIFIKILKYHLSKVINSYEQRLLIVIVRL